MLDEVNSIIQAEGGVAGEQRGESSDLVIIGEAPGLTEQQKGRPFIGKAGLVLTGMLEEAGITDYYITNACKIFPGYDKHGKIAKPTKEELERWRPVLDAELEATGATKFLLLGKYAAKLAVPGNFAMRDVVGTKHEFANGTAYIGYHPASFLYNQGTAANTRNMNTQRRVLSDLKGEESIDYEYNVISKNEAEGRWVIDVETAGETDPRRAEITEWARLNINTRESTDGGYAELCFDRGYRPPRPAGAIFHNAMFDYPILTRGDPEWLTVPEIDDTMIMAAVLGYEDLSLKGLCNQLFGVKVYDYKNRKECGKEIYNAQDVFLTRRLYEYLKPLLPGTAYDIDRSIIKILTYGELFSGYEIDQKRLAKVIEDTESEKELTEHQFSFQYPGINMGSPAQLLTVLPVQDTTADTLKELDTSEAHLILYWRKMSKALSTYLYPFRDLERISGLYRLTLAGGDHGDDVGGTTTGRLSSYSPNMQNLDPVLQRCLRAPKNKELLRADYSQIELRCIAELTQDPTLVSALLEGRDFHAETVKVLGLTGPDARRIAKVWNFGRFYGAESHYLSLVVGKSLEETEELLKLHSAFCPGFDEWVTQHFAKVKAIGYSEGMAPFSHRRKIHLFDERKARKYALNHPIQSHAAYITKAAMAEIGYEPETLEFVNQIHDELHYIIPKGDKKRRDMVKEAMLEVGNKYLPTVGIDVDVQLSRYWESKK